MFEVEKPRRFHYEPRFYDPEKEKWEALKKKYAIRKELEESRLKKEEAAAKGEGQEEDLEYFEQRVRTIDRQKREESSRLTWRDLFRKREMPKFNYQPRFSDTAVDIRNSSSEQASQDVLNSADEVVEKYRQPNHKIKIRRRFDISDPDYMKPVSGTKIILYCFIVFLLLMVIFGL